MSPKHRIAHYAESECILYCYVFICILMIVEDPLNTAGGTDSAYCANQNIIDTSEGPHPYYSVLLA